MDKPLSDDDISYITKMEDSRRQPGDNSDYVINIYDLHTQESALLNVPYRKVSAETSAEPSVSGSEGSESDGASEPERSKAKRVRADAVEAQRKKVKTLSPKPSAALEAFSGVIDTSVVRCFRRELPASLEDVRSEIFREFEKALNPLRRAVEGLQLPGSVKKKAAEEVRKGFTVRPTGMRSCAVSADEDDLLDFFSNLRESSILVPCKGKRVGIKKDLIGFWQEHMMEKDENYKHMGKDQLRTQLSDLIEFTKDERHGDLDVEHPVFSFNQKKNAGLADWDISKS